MNRTRATALWLVIILGIFSGTMATLLLATQRHESKAGLLSTGEIRLLKIQLNKTPQDQALKDVIRQKDVALRAEYLVNRQRFKTASHLLILALIGWVLAARWYFALAPGKSPEAILNELGQVGLDQARPNRSRSGVLATAGVAALLALALLWRGVFNQPLIPTLQMEKGPIMLADAAVTIAKTTLPTPDAASPFKDNWPCFRGPDNIGVAPGKGPWPQTWDAAKNKNILWKTELPLTGKSSPIVWGGRIFITGGDTKQQHVACLDRQTGKILWNTPVTPPEAPGAAEENELTGFSAPTPVTDGRNVYAVFASGVIAAFDFAGKQLWAKALGVPESTYGFATSLMLHEGTLILQFDQGPDAESKKSKLLGIDPATGAIRWSTPRPVPNSWSTPALVRTATRVELITCAAPWVIAYDPVKGTELWKVSGLDGDVAPAPTFGGGLIFVTNDRAKLLAIKPGGAGDVTATHIAWSSDQGMPDVASPVTDGKRLLQIASSGGLTCFSIADGKLLWEQNIGSGASASPIVAGGKVYLTSEDGVTRIIELGDKYKELAKCEIGEPVYGTPAFGDGRIYLRGSKHLFCIGGAQ